MSRLPSLRPAQVTAALKRAGFVLLRQRGSHRVFQHPDGSETIVPMHSGEVRTGRMVYSLIRAHGLHLMA
jgi:predicted RNA binding protein YcfA (HicA-like mRNA interferase family)